MARFSQKTRILAVSRAVALGAIGVCVAGLAAADPVRISVAQQPGAGRITFAWPAPVPFVAAISGRQLLVQFGRPVETSFAGLPGALSRYIGPPRLADGGRTVVFPLQGSFDLNYFSQGNAVIVEVVDIAGSPPPQAQAPPAPPRSPAESAPARPAAPPATAAPGQPPPPGAERIGVRIGAHDQYDRIVFDWERDVGYRVEQRGNRAYVTFERPATIALDPVRRGRTRNVAGGAWA